MGYTATTKRSFSVSLSENDLFGDVNYILCSDTTTTYHHTNLLTTTRSLRNRYAVDSIYHAWHVDHWLVHGMVRRSRKAKG
jgi:hypothetical protein